MIPHVHWHEGLFLQPHHLQAMQRSLLDRLAADRRLRSPYPYGVLEASISRDELENMRVRFDRLRAVMPGGLTIDVPGDTDLPPLEIERAFNAANRPLTVSIGVPLHYPSRANTIDLGDEADHRAKRLYRVAETEQADENTGENPQPVPVRRINARLLLDGDDRTDLETLPLLRITRGVGEETGIPRRDAGFIPPCAAVAGSDVLRDMVRDLANQLEASRKELVTQMNRGGFNADLLKGQAVQQILKLSALNRAAARLPSIVSAASALHPFDLYLELRGILGELAALHPDLDPFEARPYDHDDPGPVFHELCETIRSHLKVERSGSWMKVAFQQDNGVLIANLEEQHVTTPNEYFLGVKTNEDPRAVARLVEDADEFKLMAKSLVQTRIRGVRLAEERHPPVHLPSPVGLHYFRLMRSESARTWDRIVSERAVALKFPGADKERFEEVSLYMTVPT